MDLSVAKICQEYDCQFFQQLAVELWGCGKVSSCCPKEQVWIFTYSHEMVTCTLASHVLFTGGKERLRIPCEGHISGGKCII